MSKFKVGDKVRIRRDSEFSHQSIYIGLINEIRNSYGYPYNVWFSDGSKNDYNEIDLELIEKKKPIKYEDLIL